MKQFSIFALMALIFASPVVAAQEIALTKPTIEQQYEKERKERLKARKVKAQSHLAQANGHLAKAACFLCLNMLSGRVIPMARPINGSPLNRAENYLNNISWVNRLFTILDDVRIFSSAYGVFENLRIAREEYGYYCNINRCIAESL